MTAYAEMIRIGVAIQSCSFNPTGDETAQVSYHGEPLEFLAGLYVNRECPPEVAIDEIVDSVREKLLKHLPERLAKLPADAERAEPGSGC